MNDSTVSNEMDNFKCIQNEENENIVYDKTFIESFLCIHNSKLLVKKKK